VSGATGILYAARALKVLWALGIEAHLIVSPGSAPEAGVRNGLQQGGLASLADHVYNINDLGGPMSFL
jgi:4-hydroxy-3-polyprenylbenzoate decarboxylase